MSSNWFLYKRCESRERQELARDHIADENVGLPGHRPADPQRNQPLLIPSGSVNGSLFSGSHGFPRCFLSPHFAGIWPPSNNLGSLLSEETTGASGVPGGSVCCNEVKARGRSSGQDLRGLELLRASQSQLFLT